MPAVFAVTEELPQPPPHPRVAIVFPFETKLKRANTEHANKQASKQIVTLKFGYPNKINFMSPYSITSVQMQMFSAC